MIFSTIMPKAYAEDLCRESIAQHLYIIDESQQYFNELVVKKKRISSYEIMLFKDYVEKRYYSLKYMQRIFKDPMNNCPSATLSEAITFYDYSLIGSGIFKHTALRRVFKTIPKFEGFTYQQYKNEYKFNTSRGFINALLSKVKKEGISLPDEIQIKKYGFWRKPKLLPPADMAVNSVTSTVAGVARIWGYISDHLIWREGHLYKNNEVKELLSKKLLPLDLIFEKRTFTLSNLTIPGYWGHVAVWLGTKEDLINYGIWDKEFFAPFQRQIENGYNIAEVRKEGISFKTLDEYLNLDDVAITRVHNIGYNIDTVMNSLISQMDKKYDFKFDALSSDRLTCTEFITYSYGDYQWKQSKTFFQMNIRPDDIAKSTVGANATSSLVTFIEGTKKGYQVHGFAEWIKKLRIRKKQLTSEDLAKLSTEELEILERSSDFNNPNVPLEQL